MADINSVFGEQREYDPSKPYVTFELPTKEELIGMLMGIIPGGRALKNIHDNPESSITETLDLAAEDLVPFYAASKNGADWDDYAKEAALMFVPGGSMNVYNPSRGIRQAVRTNAKGKPNKKDLKEWADYSMQKYNNVYGNAARHEYNDPIYKADLLKEELHGSQVRLDQAQREIDNIMAQRNLPDDQRGLPVEWYDKKLIGAQNRLESYQKHHAKLLNDYNEASINALGYTPRNKNWEEVLRELDRDYLYDGAGTGYVLDKLKAEYGDKLGQQYFDEIVKQAEKELTKDPWNRVNREYPIGKRLLQEHGDL